MLFNKNLWELWGGRTQSCISFNFGTEDADRYFQNISLLVGAIVNLTEDTIRYIDIRIAAGDSSTLVDVDKDYVDNATIITNITDPQFKNSLVTDISFANLRFLPQDSIMLLLIARNNTRFRVISKYANKTAENSADSVLCVQEEFRPSKKSSSGYAWSIFAMIMFIFISLIYIYFVERHNNANYVRLLDKMIQNRNESSDEERT